MCVLTFSVSLVSCPLFCGIRLYFSLIVMIQFYSRLGEPAAGDRVSRHFPVSRVDSVQGTQPLPPLPYQHLDFQVAHCSDHVRSGT